MPRIKDLAEDERPREKLLKQGPSALTAAELIAILLRTGSAGRSAIDIAREMLLEFGGLGNLFAADGKQLEKIKGVKSAKLTALIAAIELSRRGLKEQSDVKPAVMRPADIYNRYRSHFLGLNREIFLALFLNSKNEIIKDVNLGSSTANSCICHPQEFIRSMIQYGAGRLILIHNHPSGDKKPSSQDIAFTAELSKHLAYFGFDLLDHIIIAGNGYTSMKESGAI